MLILYKAVVPPLVEYCCPLWCPANLIIGFIRVLENVFFGMEELNFWDILKELKLYSLERRRLNTNGEGNFGFQSPKMFNSLPKELGDGGDTDDLKLLERFQTNLCTFLTSIPDEPLHYSYPSGRGNKSITT